jgi:phage host-nuclease inhibitor protein Gam
MVPLQRQGNSTVLKKEKEYIQDNTLLSNNDKTADENIAYKHKYSMRKSEDNNNGKGNVSTDVHDSMNSTLNTAYSNPLTVKIEEVINNPNDPYYKSFDILIVKFNENFQILQNELLTYKKNSEEEIQGLKETVNAFTRKVKSSEVKIQGPKETVNAFTRKVKSSEVEIQTLKEELSTANKNSEDKIAEITEAYNKQIIKITNKLQLTETELKDVAERFRNFTIEATLNNTRQEFRIFSLKQELARVRSYFFAGFLGKQ